MSIVVKALSRQEIDAWPLEEAGIPVRMLTGCRRLGYKTIGKVRHLSDERLTAMRGVGLTTVREWGGFLERAHRLERGDLSFPNACALLESFLSPAESKIVSLRFGLRDPGAPLTRNVLTLQQIGSRERVTRERIRQVEASGIERLSSRMARACMEPVYQVFQGFLRKQSLVLEPSDFSVWRDQPIWGGLCPAHLMNLLGTLRPDAWREHRGYLTGLTRPQVQAIERHLVRVLRILACPVSAGQVAELTGEAMARYRPADNRRLVERILRHLPEVRRTDEGLFHAR